MTPQEFAREARTLPQVPQLFVAEFLRFYKDAWPFAAEAREGIGRSGQASFVKQTLRNLIVQLAWQVGVDLQFQLMNLTMLWQSCTASEQDRITLLFRKVSSDPVDPSNWMETPSDEVPESVASWAGSGN